MAPEAWRSDSGNPWPVKDEYEVGCTLEHAGYYVTWFVAFFGPARTVDVLRHGAHPGQGHAGGSADAGLQRGVY